MFCILCQSRVCFQVSVVDRFGGDPQQLGDSPGGPSRARHVAVIGNEVIAADV